MHWLGLSRQKTSHRFLDLKRATCILQIRWISWIKQFLYNTCRSWCPPELLQESYLCLDPSLANVAWVRVIRVPGQILPICSVLGMWPEMGRRKSKVGKACEDMINYSNPWFHHPIILQTDWWNANRNLLSRFQGVLLIRCHSGTDIPICFGCGSRAGRFTTSRVESHKSPHGLLRIFNLQHQRSYIQKDAEPQGKTLYDWSCVCVISRCFLRGVLLCSS